MNVTLTAVKYAAFASEETSCFDAVVVIDGVKAIRARNDGHGGQTWLQDIVSGSCKRLQEYAASLPVETLKLDADRTFQHQPTADSVVDGLLCDWLTLRDLRKALKKTTVFVTADGKIREFRRQPYGPIFAPLAEKYLAKDHPGARTLNALPESEALAIWKASVA